MNNPWFLSLALHIKSNQPLSSLTHHDNTLSSWFLWRCLLNKCGLSSHQVGGFFHKAGLGVIHRGDEEGGIDRGGCKVWRGKVGAKEGEE
jgi:hypothetical protein